MDDCLYCRITACQAPANVLRTWDEVIMIASPTPVAREHFVLIAREHVPDVGAKPTLAAVLMLRAGEVAREHPNLNIIASQGEQATQGVKHLSLDLVTRQDGDRLPLPWSPEPFTRQLAALRALEDDLTEKGMPETFGATTDCATATVLARVLATTGHHDDAVSLLFHHGLYDDADQEHYDLTKEHAAKLAEALASAALL